MKKPNSNDNARNGGVLKKIYKIFDKAIKETSAHPLMSILMFLFTIILVWLGIRTLLYMAKDQPVEQLQVDTAKIIINIRIKIVNISEGCKGNNTYSQALQRNNEDRLNLVGQLLAMSKGADVKKNLGLKAQDQIACFVKYNDMLSLRTNICEGGFLTEQKMKVWEEKIIHDLNHKSNAKVNCPYDGKAEVNNN
jgi:hypothetical protein